MPRTPAIAILALAALSAGCAIVQAPAPSEPTPAAGAASAPEATRRPTPPAATRRPAFDWPAVRTRLARALDGGTDIVVSVRPDETLQLVVPGADAFASDSSEPRPMLRATLDRIAGALVDPPQTRILVLGHTDSMGRELRNLQLSIQRAEAVADYLRTRGISLARLTADGRGEADPIADNATEAGRARNRRVEIIVLPPE